MNCKMAGIFVLIHYSTQYFINCIPFFLHIYVFSGTCILFTIHSVLVSTLYKYQFSIFLNVLFFLDLTKIRDNMAMVVLGLSCHQILN